MAERDRAGEEDKINEIQKTFENRIVRPAAFLYNTCWCWTFLLLLTTFTVLFVKTRVRAFVKIRLAFRRYLRRNRPFK